MAVECPSCKSRFLLISKTRTLREKLNRLRFVLPLRCGDCRTRFTANTLQIKDLKWARCPGCLRQDLSTWSTDKAEPVGFDVIKVALGANLWRCEYCRLNFASFRPRQEVHSFRRWQKLSKKIEKL